MLQVVDEAGFLRRGRHLVGDHAQEVARLGRHRHRRREVEGDRPEHAARRLERQRHERAEAELGGDLLPILERRVREEIGHLDHAPLARRLAAGTKAESHAHVAEERRVSFGPVVHGLKPHELGGAVH